MNDSPYTVTRLMTADFVRQERSQRYRPYKLRAHLDLARELSAIGATDAAVAQRFGVTPESIYNLRTRKTYRNV